MADENGAISWYDPDPRAILPLNEFHVSRSLRRVVRQGKFDIHFDRSFGQVIRACAEPGKGREYSWISPEIIVAYEWLHQLGHAHSVESWYEGELVGGLYGVAINGLFAGESMFTRHRNASKVALVYLVSNLRDRGYLLLDIQMMTEHLKQFGAIEIPREQYKYLLAKALRKATRF